MNTSTTKTKNHASGIGGSHARWNMFGARGPLLAPEGDGGAGGASSSTTGSGGDSGTTTASNSGAGSAAKVTFTAEQQEEVNRIAARSREEGRKAAGKTTSSTTSTTTNTPSGEGGSTGEEKLTLKALQQRLDESEQRRVFEKHATKAGIPEDASDDLFELYKAQKPADSAQWFASKKALFGFTGAAGTQQQTTTTTTQTGGTAGDGKTAAAAPGAPAKVDPVTTGGMVDIWNLSLEQLKALGPQGLRAEHEKILAVGRSQSGAPPVPSVLRRK